jgi:hypothetical protein
LVVVIGLLGLLMLLGFGIFSFANMESENAIYFTEAAQQPVDEVIRQPSIKIMMDWALDQIILGAPPNRSLSALTGGDKGLVPLMFARDIYPFSGPGRNVLEDGLPSIINHSAAANGGTARDLTGQPDPDVDYTTPDINNQFLAFVGYGLDTQNRPVLIVKPSYHRPEVVRSLGVGAGNFSTSATTTRAVLRAHSRHAADAAGTKSRFVSDPAVASALGLRGTFPFPYTNRVQGIWRMRTWSPNTAYTVGDFVEPQVRDGYFYECRLSGTSGTGAEPTWPTLNDGEVLASSGIIWRRKAQPRYEYDADPDQDGIKEAIWVDLDFPAQQITAQKWVVPMFAITIYDADGLINLNQHGNLSGLINLGQVATPFGGVSGGQVQPIHRSNLGLLPSEINPLYALAMRRANELHDPSLFLNIYDDQVQQFGRAPASPMELANMAWFFANEGRFEYGNAGSATDGFPGRYGELARLFNANAANSTSFADFPHAGLSGANDNNNASLALNPGGGRRMVHPLDYRGTGQHLDGTGKKRLFKYAPDGVNRWLGYEGFSSTAGNVPSWGTPYGSPDLQLMRYNEPNALLDEPGELDTDAPTPKDSPFAVSEAAYLQYTGSGRLKSLMKYAMDTRPSDATGQLASVLQKEIRKRFTPLSVDLRTVSRTRYTSNTPKFRSWEFDADGHFPPHFEVPSEPFRAALQTWLSVENGVQNGSPQQYVQRLFSINQVLDDSSGTPVLRNLIDHPLAPLGALGNLPQGELPTSGIQADYDVGVDPADPHPQWQEYRARLDRQRMARDLYVMLYTFCGGKNVDYTTRNAIDGNDTSRDAGPGDRTRPLYTDVQLREMAQFAVNIVDALDRDNVITMFEYDKDLNNGWGLDDNPYETPESSTDRGVVYGREAEQLTISESMLVLCKKVIDNNGDPADHAATEFDDKKHRDFSYIELRNASRFPINFQDGNWQLVIEPVPGAAGVAAPILSRYLTLKAGTNNTGRVAAGGLFTIGTAGDAEDLDPATSDPRPSHMRMQYDVELDNNGDIIRDATTKKTTPLAGFERIAPYLSVNTADNLVPLGLDLITQDQQDAFVLANADKKRNNTPGDFLHLHTPDAVTPGSVKVRLVLRRRLHPTREAPELIGTDAIPDPAQSRDNPWIEVDRVVASVKVFALEKDDADVVDVLRVQLTGVKSKERAQSLAPSDERQYTRPDNKKYEHNTIGDTNGASAGIVNSLLWEAHFDRDFISSAELLSLPLYGPDALRWIPDPNDSNKRIQRRIDRGHGLKRSGEWLAGVRKILHPRDYDGYGPDRQPGDAGFDDDANNTDDDAGEWGTLGTDDRKLPGDSVGDAKYDNRWHRLLGLAGVPSRAAPMNRYRVGGRLNPNAFRHPEVYAGLLDDRAAFPLTGFNPLRPGSKQTSYLTDTTEGTARDWWVQLIRSRDGLDVPTQLYIPGMSVSRPFRGFDHVARGIDSINDTLLRELPYDANLNPHPDESRRHLLELGTRGERYQNNVVDHHTRHRLLSKVLSNTTTRSNVFFVFVEVGFFEAASDGGVFRLGEKSKDVRSARGFFVVDRSRAFRELNNGSNDFNPGTSTFTIKADNPATAADEGFNFRNLILYSTY